MTEAEWLVCEDPGVMVENLQVGRGDAFPAPFRLVSARKWGLFACACCAASKLADTPARRAQFLRWEDQCDGGSYDRDSWVEDPARWARAHANENGPNDAPPSVRAALLREIIGNPFRAVTHSVGLPGETRMHIVGPHCIPGTWLTPDVLGMAQTAYDKRDWGILPILADALEDAGCREQAILEHLRSECESGMGRCDYHPHARGCWVLDLLLGKS